MLRDDVRLEQIHKALQNHPSYEEFHSIVQQLNSESGSKILPLAHPSALSARVVDQLVRHNISDFWRTFYAKDISSSNRQILTRCLRNVVALGSIASRLKALILVSENENKLNNSDDFKEEVVFLLELLVAIIEDESFSNLILSSLHSPEENNIKNQMVWTNFVNMVASGKLLAILAQASTIVKDSQRSKIWNWMTVGDNYAQWLGCNVVFMIQATDLNNKDDFNAIAAFIGKALGMGYKNAFVKPLFKSFVMKSDDFGNSMRSTIQNLRESEKKSFLRCVMKFISEQEERTTNQLWLITDSDKLSNRISALSFVLSYILKDDIALRTELVNMLTDASGAIAADGVLTLRVAICVLATAINSLQEVFERNLHTFSNKLFIKHASILHQQVVAQCLLLAAGYIYRSSPMFIYTLARSSIHTSGTSSRLSAPSKEARFLGMVVSSAISALIDKPDNKITFEFDQSREDEVNWYMNLVYINDQIGTREDMSTTVSAKMTETGGSNVILDIKKQSKPKYTSKTFEIVEAEKEESEDDDLLIYKKPDSDPEDEEEDPTLVNRNRPTPPVYIRDLITGLNDNENFEKHNLALKWAADLISRKASFGKEVADLIYDLASTLLGLKNYFDNDDFEELRLKAMIAVLLAMPKEIGSWFSREFFNGDYSISQRVAILSTIGLGTRQLAGYDKEIVGNTAEKEPGRQHPYFRNLPEHLHRLYINDSLSIDKAANALEKSIVEPVALKAADKITGPNVLKTRTFSSRMNVEKRKKKPITNPLAKIVNESFFAPLTGLWDLHMQNSGPKSIYLESPLLPHFLKTLALLFHAAGTSTLALPQMTQDFWNLLLTLRARSLDDIFVLESMLFALLVILEVNADSNSNKQRLMQEHGKELQQTQEWTDIVFGRYEENERDEEGSRIKTLAAGVLVKIKEVTDFYRDNLLNGWKG